MLEREFDRRDPRLWDSWDWSELAPETLAAIEYFQEQARPPARYTWNEDALVPRIRSSLPRRSGFEALVRGLMSGGRVPT